MTIYFWVAVNTVDKIFIKSGLLIARGYFQESSSSLACW